MANTGFISVAPQIAALAAQVTAVDLVVDAIRATDFPTTDALVNAAGIILTDLHDVDMPAVQTVIDANAVILADLHDTDIPGVLTAINNKEIRAAYKHIYHNETPGDVNFHDVLNITKPGYLKWIKIKFHDTDGQIRITLDGVSPLDYTVAMGACYFIYYATAPNDFNLDKSVTYETIDQEFNTSLRVEVKQTNGGNVVNCSVLYNEHN